MAGLGLGVGSKEWAHRLEQRYAAGEPIAPYAVQSASEVLGRRLLRGGKHARRPDVKDRAAGDDGFDGVPI